MPDPETSPEEQHLQKVQGLFLQYLPSLRAMVLGMIPDFSVADDVIQETFLVVTRKASTFTPGTSFPAWVRSIARLKCLEALRSRHTRFESLSSEVWDSLWTDAQDHEPSPDDRIQHLRLCLDRLAPQARRSIEYRYRNDHLPPQIASLMGTSVQSVNVTLSRARTFLRECVKRQMAQSSNPS